MRTTIVLAALALSLLPLGAVAGEPSSEQQPATLQALVRSTLATHESMERARSAIRRADADVRLTTSALLPRLDLNGTYTRYQNEVAFELSPGQSFVIQPLADWNYSADLKQTLFYGLRDWRARDVAGVNRESAVLERSVTASDLALRVSQSFFDAVAAEQRLAVRHTALEQDRAQLKVAQRRFEVGELTSADVSRWTARVAADEQDVVTSEGALELARRRLARMAGIRELGALAPPSSVASPEGSMAELERRALIARPEMMALDKRLQAARLMIRVEKGAWLPELDAHAQYFAQRADFPSRDWMSLSLTLRVPIYDGGVTSARVAKAREDLMDVEVMRRETDKTIRDQVESALISHRTAVAALEAAEKRRTAAREAYRQVERAYAVGEATVTDLLTSTTELTDAKTAAVIAHWQRELQAIALRHAVGQPPVPGVTFPSPDGDAAPITEKPETTPPQDPAARSEP
ncbi:MAG: TolC family protein [Acidobacteria bacterium]|jgi:outer membrane protein|nr:TolC family protein [Acidobacteriota bacterium]